MSGARHWEQDKEATVYIGNLDERVTDSLVWELMLQAGRIVNVHLPKDRVTQTHQGYGFVEFKSEEDADYAARIMNQVRMYGKPIRVNKASADKQKSLEIGAELFIGNLDPMVNEQTLYETFSRFGGLLSVPKIARDDANLSRGFGFVSFSNFEASDEAIANLNGQYLMNKEISVQYAYKKDGKGERHGDEAERMLATQAKKHMVQPTPQALPAGLMTPTTPMPGVMDAAMAAGHPPMGAGMPGPPPMAMFPGGGPPPMPVGFQNMGGGMGAPPPPPGGRMAGPPPVQHQLPTPPSGLPPRPPPSQAGYGGPPQGYMPPGFGGPPGMPPGFPNSGQPPQMPPGFQQAGRTG